MKKVLLLVLSVAVVMSASASFSQPGTNAIMLYTDQVGPTCNLVTSAAILRVYAVHDFVVGATASQFGIDDQSGMSFVSGSALHQVAVSQPEIRDGIAVTYDLGCESAPIAVVEYIYFGSGAEPACGTITVVPDVGVQTGEIEGVDCGFVKNFPNGSVMTINSDGSCICRFPPAAEENTWGGVKALFR